MTTYAKQTSVPVSKTRDDIERVMERYGAEAFQYTSLPGAASVAFFVKGRQVRFVLDVPAVDQFAKTPTGRDRTPGQTNEEHRRAVRQRWRALLLVIKAKLEAVESGIAVFEDEFLAYTVLPSGRTVSAELSPQIEAAIASGSVTPLQIEGPR